jgi:putative transcriptional regulator
MSEAGSKLIKSARQALAYAHGEATEGVVAHVPDEVDVKSIRQSLGLTQPEFSRRFGFDIRAVQDWEQKRLKPERSARVLLTVIAHEPEAVRLALAGGLVF